MIKDIQQRQLDIIQNQKTVGVSLVNGGIRIDASGKPIETVFHKTEGQVYVVLDCSGSMSGYKLDQAKQGVRDFTNDAIKKGYLVGLIKFSSKAQHLCEPTKDINKLTLQMQSLKATGSTNMAQAINMAHERLKSIEGSKVILIATDGQPDNVKASLNSALSAKNDGIEIIAIGTDDAVQAFLKQIASRNELGTKVSTEMFAQTISSAHLLLPSPKSMVSKQS
jgi:Mg-chelatase subunit ChlD